MVYIYILFIYYTYTSNISPPLRDAYLIPISGQIRNGLSYWVCHIIDTPLALLSQGMSVSRVLAANIRGTKTLSRTALQWETILTILSWPCGTNMYTNMEWECLLWEIVG